MSDLVAMLSISAMFVVAVLYVHSCERLKGGR
jgi:hypothetical protein